MKTFAMIEASCHCGNVHIELESAPDHLLSCNCSICRRLGALWAYYRPDQVTVRTTQSATVGYIQGDRTLATHHCPTCACITHWESLQGLDRMGVNGRLIAPADLEGIPIRHIDGADTWKMLD